MRKIIVIILISFLLSVFDVSGPVRTGVMLPFTVSLIWTLAIFLRVSPKHAILAAVVCGIVLDSASVYPFGVFTLSLLLVCVVIISVLPQIVKTQKLFFPIYAATGWVALITLVAALSSFLSWLGSTGATLQVDKQLMSYLGNGLLVNFVAALCILGISHFTKVLFIKRFLVTR